MFHYGILITEESPTYAQYQLLKNGSQRLVSEFKSAISQGDVLMLWEAQQGDDGIQPYLQTIESDLKQWHGAGIRFQVCRQGSAGEWHTVADFTTESDTAEIAWQQEVEYVLRIESALQNILADQREPEDFFLLEKIIRDPLPEGVRPTTSMLSRILPLQNRTDRRELAIMLQSKGLRQFFTATNQEEALADDVDDKFDDELDSDFYEDFDEDDEDEDGSDDEKKSGARTLLGCAFMLVYLLMACMEVVAGYQWFTWRFDLHGVLAAPIALVCGFTPGLGSIIAYWTATEIWQWPSWQAVVVFFWYYLPLALMFSSLLFLLGAVGVRGLWLGFTGRFKRSK